MLSTVISHIRALHNFLGSVADASRVQSMKMMLRQPIEKRFMSNIPLKSHFNVLISKVHVLSTAVDLQGINYHFFLMSKNIWLKVGFRPN